LIDPLKAPLPTARNLPFHPVVGIQSSTVMSESLDGVKVSITRQYARGADGSPSTTVVRVTLAF
jgi:hypothetical protein